MSGLKSSGARLAGRSRLANTSDRIRMEAKSPARKCRVRVCPVKDLRLAPHPGRMVVSVEGRGEGEGDGGGGGEGEALSVIPG